MIGESARQSLDQLIMLDFQSAARQAGELVRIGLPPDHGLQDVSGGDPGQIGDDAGQFDLGILQQLLQPLPFPTPVPQNGGA